MPDAIEVAGTQELDDLHLHFFNRIFGLTALLYDVMLHAWPSTFSFYGRDDAVADLVVTTLVSEEVIDARSRA